MRILHISDFHLPSRLDKQVNGVSPYGNLQKAVGEAKRQVPKPDLVVLGGDLFEEGDKGDYRAVYELLGELQIPVHTVVGNHDHLPALRKAWGSAPESGSSGYYSFDQGGQHVAVLNSVVPGKPHGRLDEEQLLWLNADLHEHRAKPVLIFLHHPPFDSGVAWLDKMRLLNAESFWEVIPPFSSNIRGVFVSHLHIALACCYRQILLASTPATCWQYQGSADAAKAALSVESPGFNLIDVSASQVSLRTVRFPAVSPEEIREAPAAQTGMAPSSGQERSSGHEPSPGS